jgi:hypothetical protein
LIGRLTISQHGPHMDEVSDELNDEEVGDEDMVNGGNK